ncbi:MAG: hypothetical protein EOP52_02400 [Sphingobacteriales bacterium]|nr:MAG: hypothetical protein EOP52_02400 [Sphingobacteriales bacterium]
MTFVKLSALALSFAVFAASCTSNTEENTTVNTDTVAPATEMVAPVAPMDTTMAAPATGTMTTTDTMMTPNGTAVEKTTTTTETK